MAKRGSVAQRLEAVKDRSTLQLTTRGRRTGKRHTVTVWFLVEEETLYLVTMKMRRDWARNLLKNGFVEADVDGAVFAGRGKQIKDRTRLARVNELLSQKYWMAWLGSWFGLGPDGAFAVTIDG
jgi:F420H(2)-dependent quinone reductase